MSSPLPALRDLSPLDLPAVLALNIAATPAVPTATEEELAALLEASAFGFVAAGEDELLGFVIGFAPGSDYASRNYRYFEDRGTDHLYVDRIVVAESARGMRIGQRLYERVIGLAVEQGRAEITCEVNLDPPNPGSLAFHDRMGFREVGQQETGYATVSLLARPLA
jgi:predicted GNAT superfamily acetyltransferase